MPSQRDGGVRSANLFVHCVNRSKLAQNREFLVYTFRCTLTLVRMSCWNVFFVLNYVVCLTKSLLMLENLYFSVTFGMHLSEACNSILFVLSRKQLFVHTPVTLHCAVIFVTTRAVALNFNMQMLSKNGVTLFWPNVQNFTGILVANPAPSCLSRKTKLLNAPTLFQQTECKMRCVRLSGRDGSGNAHCHLKDSYRPAQAPEKRAWVVQMEVPFQKNRQFLNCTHKTFNCCVKVFSKLVTLHATLTCFAHR